MAWIHVALGRIDGIDLEYISSAKSVYLQVCLIPTGRFQRTKSVSPSTKTGEFDFHGQVLTFEVTKKEYLNLMFEFNIMAKAKPDDLPIARFPMFLRYCPLGFQIRGDFDFISAHYYPPTITATIKMHVALSRTIPAFTDNKKDVNIKEIQQAALTREKSGALTPRR
jgi:hypothetical protein